MADGDELPPRLRDEQGKFLPSGRHRIDKKVLKDGRIKIRDRTGRIVRYEDPPKPIEPPRQPDPLPMPQMPSASPIIAAARAARQRLHSVWVQIISGWHKPVMLFGPCVTCRHYSPPKGKWQAIHIGDDFHTRIPPSGDGWCGKYGEPKSIRNNASCHQPK